MTKFTVTSPDGTFMVNSKSNGGLKLRLQKKNFGILLCVIVLAQFLPTPPGMAQGLKGATNFDLHSGRTLPPFVKGKSDAQRWSTVASIGPSLIGMNRATVETKLGNGLWDGSRKQLQYAMGEGNPSGKGYDYTNVLIKFDAKGVVIGYEITSMDWH